MSTRCSRSNLESAAGGDPCDLGAVMGQNWPNSAPVPPAQPLPLQQHEVELEAAWRHQMLHVAQPAMQAVHLATRGQRPHTAAAAAVLEMCTTRLMTKSCAPGSADPDQAPDSPPLHGHTTIPPRALAQTNSFYNSCRFLARRVRWTQLEPRDSSSSLYCVRKGSAPAPEGAARRIDRNCHSRWALFGSPGPHSFLHSTLSQGSASLCSAAGQTARRL